MVNNPLNAIILFIDFSVFFNGSRRGKTRLSPKSNQYKRQLKAISIVSLLLGMSIKMLPYVTVYHFGTIFVQDYLGGLVTYDFLYHGNHAFGGPGRASRLLHPLSYIGRMSMSNYLFQSMVCMGIFYSYGLGLYGSVSYTTGFVFLIALFCLQILLSLIVDGPYEYGPVEYIWRFFTYGKKPVMRR